MPLTDEERNRLADVIGYFDRHDPAVEPRESIDYMMRVVTRLDRENVALRDALEKISELGHIATVRGAWRIARAALRPDAEEKPDATDG